MRTTDTHSAQFEAEARVRPTIQMLVRSGASEAVALGDLLDDVAVSHLGDTEANGEDVTGDSLAAVLATSLDEVIEWAQAAKSNLGH